MSSSQADQLSGILETDPYVSLKLLGQGSYGFVDKVESKSNPGPVFARKTVRISGRYRERNLRTALNEARILRRLDHRHIVRILELYICQNNLSIIMLEVGDCNMKKYLEDVDTMGDKSKRDAMRITLQMWPGCLIQAIDYLHEMRIKHKDLRPENLIIKGDQIWVADFGISKDLIDEETSATAVLTPEEPGCTGLLRSTKTIAVAELPISFL